MTVSPKIWTFPTFSISKQVFHVPGVAASGGFTSGGVRIMTPEPGGFGMLEVQPALQLGEWDYPLASWIMSKVNGEVLRFRLAPTPQVASARAILSDQPWNAEGIYSISPWENLQNWVGDIPASFSANALVGSNVLTINFDTIGPILQPGHVIGHAGETYLVDEIEYVGTIGTMVVKPPLRRNVTIGDLAYFRPFFTGQIANGAEIVQTYDAENAGAIQIPKIVFSEVITP